MSKPLFPIPKKIRTEDFDSEMLETIEKIAFVYNQNADDVYRNLTFADRTIVSYNVTLDATSKIVNPSQIKVTLGDKIKGLNVINAVNVNSPTTYPLSQPFLSWAIGTNGLLTITNVTGLQASSQYVLTIEIIS
jgi:hypothetical protein